MLGRARPKTVRPISTDERPALSETLSVTAKSLAFRVRTSSDGLDVDKFPRSGIVQEVLSMTSKILMFSTVQPVIPSQPSAAKASPVSLCLCTSAVIAAAALHSVSIDDIVCAESLWVFDVTADWGDSGCATPTPDSSSPSQAMASSRGILASPPISEVTTAACATPELNLEGFGEDEHDDLRVPSPSASGKGDCCVPDASKPYLRGEPSNMSSRASCRERRKCSTWSCEKPC